MTRCQGFLTQSVCGAPNHHLRNRIAALNAGHDLATPRRGHDVHKLPARLLWCPEVYHRATQYQHKTAVRRYAMSALPINFLSDDDPAEPVDTREPATCLDEAAMVDAKHKPVRNGTHSCLSGVRMVEFVSLCELRSQSEDVWRSLAQEKDLVVTSNGKPIAILSATTEATLEASLAALRQARAQLAVAAMQQRARETRADRLTLEDVNAEISAARRARSG